MHRRPLKILFRLPRLTPSTDYTALLMCRSRSACVFLACQTIHKIKLGIAPLHALSCLSWFAQSQDMRTRNSLRFPIARSVSMQTSPLFLALIPPLVSPPTKSKILPMLQYIHTATAECNILHVVDIQPCPSSPRFSYFSVPLSFFFFLPSASSSITAMAGYRPHQGVVKYQYFTTPWPTSPFHWLVPRDCE